MLIKLFKITKIQQKYKLQEILLNPDFIINITSNEIIKDKLNESSFNDGLDFKHEFCDVLVSEGNRGNVITVVGDKKYIENLINKSNQKIILKG